LSVAPSRNEWPREPTRGRTPRCRVIRGSWAVRYLGRCGRRRLAQVWFVRRWSGPTHARSFSAGYRPLPGLVFACRITVTSLGCFSVPRQRPGGSLRPCRPAPR
jgi:hypothetical protein